MTASLITVSTTVSKPLMQVWDSWTAPAHIVNWYFASDDWEVGEVTNDLRTGGKFSTFMRAKDGSAGFDFNGIYTAVRERALIDYTIEDGRTVHITFSEGEEGVTVTETFEPENENTEDLQRAGWQAILENFKRYTESIP
jgi:uncharacterized protein YndB with AHSA1/START domain